MPKKIKNNSHKEEQPTDRKKNKLFRPKPKSMEEFSTAYKKQPNEIKNKQKRV